MLSVKLPGILLFLALEEANLLQLHYYKGRSGQYYCGGVEIIRSKTVKFSSKSLSNLLLGNKLHSFEQSHGSVCNIFAIFFRRYDMTTAESEELYLRNQQFLTKSPTPSDVGKNSQRRRKIRQIRNMVGKVDWTGKCWENLSGGWWANLRKVVDSKFKKKRLYKNRLGKVGRNGKSWRGL